ncbi:hypothetical protein H1304_002500 [Salmonella enterica]|nr:hypothetical protein [Salmonella enterica]
MKDIPHWDVDEDYIVDVTEGHILFSTENATKQERKLASAAPNLLEALQLAEKAMVEGRSVTYPEWYGVINKARAAISKAFGED